MQNNPITTSEWQIMRALWELGKSSSLQVIRFLQDSTNWSPTTVKTFLARLVEKNLVGYEEQGKMYIYYPIITEHECVILEMKGILSRVYGGVMHHESPHFQFYGVHNELLIGRLDNALEASYSRVETVYGFHPLEKQIVYLYPSKSRFYSALGLNIAPEWLRAGWEWNILHIAPEAEFTDISIEAATIHVWMQRVIHEINPSAPYWLTQGISTYESKWLSTSRFNRAMDQNKATLSARTIQNLPTNYESFRSQNGYELAYSVVDYITTQYGWNRLVEFLQSPYEIEKIFLVDENTFWNQWMAYVRFHFMNVQGE
jgi:BlaI family penicillinase repressor